jgi:hypothetical protein
MEIITFLIELIPTVGFPIVCVVALGWFVYRIYKRSEEREDKLLTELTETRKVNEKAIETIAKYAENLEVIQQDISQIKTDITILTSKAE